jgi:hypothetical protein
MAATGLLGINPYRQGQGIDISSKPTAIYVDMQQKERARQDALDRYFMEFDKNINPAGMRTFDIDDLTKMQMDAKQYFFKNKDNIKNPMKDGGKAYTEWMGMNKKQLALVTASKSEAESAKQYQKLYQAATSKGQTVDEGTLAAFAQSQKRIADPEFNSFNLSEFGTYTPFNAIKAKERYFGKDGKNFTQEEVAYSKTPDGKRDLVTTSTVLNPTPENLTTIKKLAGADFEADLAKTGNPGGFARYIFAIQKDPEAKAQLNELHKQYYKTDIQDEKDVAAAVVIGLAPTMSKTKPAPQDAETRFQKSLAFFGYRQNYGGRFDPDYEMAMDYKGLNTLTKAEGFRLKQISDDRIAQVLEMPGIKNASGGLPSDLKKVYSSKEGGIRNPDFILQDANFNIHIIKQPQEGGEVKYVMIPYNVYKNDYTKARAGTSAVKNDGAETPAAPKTPALKNVVQGKPDKGL